MGFDLDDDFCLTSVKKGGGARKQKREKTKNDKKGGSNSCYSSKHIRVKESLLAERNNDVNTNINK